MTKRNIELIGWLGVGCILLAYILTNFDLLGLKSPIYLFLNLIGSMAIILEATTKRDYPPVVLNLVWVFVALINLLHLVLG